MNSLPDRACVEDTCLGISVEVDRELVSFDPLAPKISWRNDGITDNVICHARVVCELSSSDSHAVEVVDRTIYIVSIFLRRDASGSCMEALIKSNLKLIKKMSVFVLIQIPSLEVFLSFDI
jgi:hypothetical protein